MKFIKRNYDWMLLDVSTPAEQLDANIHSKAQYAPDGKRLHIFSIRSNKVIFYRVYACTFVDQDIQIQNDEKYNEDIHLLSIHYKTMLKNN